MRNWSRQQWFAGALVVLLGYLIWSRVIAPSIGSEPGSSAVSMRRNSQQVTPIVMLRTDLLEPNNAVYKRERNVFAYQRKQAKPRSTQPKATPPPQPQRQQKTVEPASSEPQLPTFNLSYLGSFGPRNRPIAVFLEGEDLYNVRVGDVVKDEFVLLQVGFESADVGYVNFPDQEPKRLAITGS